MSAKDCIIILQKLNTCIEEQRAVGYGDEADASLGFCEGVKELMALAWVCSAGPWQHTGSPGLIVAMASGCCQGLSLSLPRSHIPPVRGGVLTEGGFESQII